MDEDEGEKELDRLSKEEKTYQAIEKRMFEQIGRLSLTFNFIDDGILDALKTVETKLPNGSEVHRVKNRSAFSRKRELLLQYGPWFLKNSKKSKGVDALTELLKDADDLSDKRNHFIHSTVVPHYEIVDLEEGEQPSLKHIKFSGGSMASEGSKPARTVDNKLIMELRLLNAEALTLLMRFNDHWSEYFRKVSQKKTAPRRRSLSRQ